MVGTIFPDARGELTVLLLPDGMTLGNGLACSRDVPSVEVAITGWPMPYQVDRVPAGTFTVTAIEVDPADLTTAYLGADRITVRDDGWVFTTDGAPLQSVDIAITGTAVYDCTAN